MLSRGIYLPSGGAWQTARPVHPLRLGTARRLQGEVVDDDDVMVMRATDSLSRFGDRGRRGPAR